MWVERWLKRSAIPWAFCVVAVLESTAHADLVVPELETPVVVDFQTFAGSGFAPTPAAGQLDSDEWRVTGFSDGDTAFGGTHTSGDFARGTSSGGVTTGGVYAFDTGAGNTVLGVQPSGGDFTPGTIELRIVNATGTTVPSWDIEYDVFVFNDQNRSNSFNFSFSTDGVAFTSVPALDFTSPEVADGAPAWSSVHRTTTIEQPIAPGGNLFLHWRGDDVAGSGSRDEFGLDNVSVTANPEPSSLLLMSVGAGLLAGWQHRRRKHAA